MSGYPDLESCCRGGRISPEAVGKVGDAIEACIDAIRPEVLRDYRRFMKDLESMFGPPPTA